MPPSMTQTKHAGPPTRDAPMISIVHNDKPLDIAPAGARQDLLSLTNQIHVMNNLCVRVTYADKKRDHVHCRHTGRFHSRYES